MEPYWALRTASVPFWLTFNVQVDAEDLSRYLDDATPPFDDILLMLFSHGVESVGVESIAGWRSMLARARRCGAFVGVDTRAYPRDFAVFVRYHTQLKRLLRERYPLPEPLTLAQLDAFLAEHDGRYAVRVEDAGAAEPGSPAHELVGV